METVPDFQSLMIPVLSALSDGTIKSVRQVYDGVADAVGVSAEDRAVTLANRRDSKFDNRVAWTISHLYRARLLDRPGRGRVEITERGRDVLRNGPSRLTLRFLRTFPEYTELRTPDVVSALSTADVDDTMGSPEEVIDENYRLLRAALAQDVLDRLKRVSPSRFEQIVVDVLVAMGYGGSRDDAGHVVGRSGDGGIDGVIKEDRLGLDQVYVQAKRWEGNVGGPIVQSFMGSLETFRATKGVLITTSSFTNEARAIVDRVAKRIVLIDGRLLAEYMIEFDVGLALGTTYVIKRIDPEYFEPG